MGDPEGSEGSRSISLGFTVDPPSSLKGLPLVVWAGENLALILYAGFARVKCVLIK